MRAFKAGFVYFVLVFALGFALGVVRVVFVVPWLGVRWAELLELPLMVLASYWAARFCVRRFGPFASASRIGMGALALGLLMAAELVLAVALGRSIGDYVSHRDPVSGFAYLISLILFAAMPLLVGGNQEPEAKMPSFRILAKVLLLSGLASLAGVAALLGVAEWKLRRTHDVPLAPLETVRGPVDYAEGERLSRIVGCWSGCHGMTGQGGSIDMDGYYSVTAPNLDFSVHEYSDPELARLIRFGIKRDGSSALGMISYTFYPLSDEDLGNIIAHLRRQPMQPAAPRHRAITLAARFKLAMGKWQVAADQIDATRPRWGELPRTTPFERGRYLASITCSECHGLDFRGNEFEDNTYDGGPSLAIIALYGRDEFRRLMRTGEPIGGRDLGEMSWVARNGFVHFKDEEIDDMRTFLRVHHGLPEEPPG